MANTCAHSPQSEQGAPEKIAIDGQPYTGVDDSRVTSAVFLAHLSKTASTMIGRLRIIPLETQFVRFDARQFDRLGNRFLEALAIPDR